MVSFQDMKLSAATDVVQNYASWVRQNPENSSTIEQLVRTLTYIFSNPTSLIQMEGAFSASNAFVTVNNFIRGTELRPWDLRLKIALLQELLRTFQCFVEMWLRKNKGHKAGWIAVILCQMVHAVLNMWDKRHEIRSTLFPQKQQAASGGGSLHIPRVCIPSRGVQASSGAKSSWADKASTLLDVFSILRPLIYSVVCAISFLRRSPKANLIRLPNIRRSHASLSPSWHIWGFFVALEAAAFIATIYLQPYKTSFLVQEDDGTTLEERQQMQQVLDASVVQKRARDLSYNMLRDPFFTVVLRQFISRNFVTGWLNKIPLLGSILATQVTFLLMAQQQSFQYTLCE